MARLQILGPVFWYDMLTSSRRTRYFLIRGLYASLLLFVLQLNYSIYSTYVAASLATTANVAATFFEGFAFVQLCLVLFVTPAMVATTIAQERERKTIEYLFATQLSNSEIVLGKLGAKLAQVAFLLLAGLPILSIAMLMGGISPESLLLVFLATLASLAMTAGFSIFVSATAPRARDAVLRVYVVLIALIIVPSLLNLLWTLIGFMALAAMDLSVVSYLIETASHLNPFSTLWAVFDAGLRLPDVSPWDRILPVIAWQAGLGLTFTALAVAIVRRSHLKETSRGARPRRKTRRGAPLRPIQGAPMIWKEMYAERGLQLGRVAQIALWLPLVTLASIVGFLLLQISDGRGFGAESVVVTASTFGTLVACLGLAAVLVRAATSITSEKERDCWIALISTPLAGRDIVRGKFWGALYSGRWIGGLAVLLWGAPSIFVPTFAVSLVVSCSVVFVLATFVAALGIHISLRSKTSLRAILTALLIVFTLGGAYLFCCLPVVLIGSLGGRGESLWQVVMSPCIPFLVAAPTMMWAASTGPDSELLGLLAAAVIGTLGYAIVAAAMYSSNGAHFDRLAGRKPQCEREHED